MERRSKGVVLVSGGLDSAALLEWALGRFHAVQPVYCRFGLRWERAELYWLNRLLRAIRRPSLFPLAVLNTSGGPLYGNHWSMTGKHVPGYRSRDNSVYLPGRNALLLTQAFTVAVGCKADVVAVGTLAGNPFPDATPRFFKAMGRALSLAFGRPLRIDAPFCRLTKETVLRTYRNFPLGLAFSCLNPRGLLPCGKCNKCAERDRATSFFS